MRASFSQQPVHLRTVHALSSLSVLLHSAPSLLDEVDTREGSQFEMMLDRALSLKRYAATDTLLCDAFGWIEFSYVYTSMAASLHPSAGMTQWT